MINLDDMLTKSEAAAWLRMSERELNEKSSGHRPPIPAFRINQVLVRFHPRTIIAHFAAEAGVSQKAQAAMFGITINQTTQ